ncbi:glucose 1-dehydrogenase [Aquibacillus albus]|uniref:NAD(P)-dependent dehydrogenase (Short-subunit alcohol dehydrogenase family) n=1 Tax=Aquibacillus albus TaxID=1168171 RepID=A0ABS2N0A5_9BACI|nr:glucose 1-dehydrogenase [Aquibacillus albus]MBM7571584.1 NAD(P)-dependent dehydrogenase (short-subunit alcohol dehydrogenase family) [Aquibacillus albus]
MEFNKRVVIVTGSSNGIGKGIAEAYASEGAYVVVADIDEVAGQNTVEVIKNNNGNASYVRTDLRNPVNIVDLMNKTIELYGKIDILINNAGVSRFKPLYDLSVEEWDDVININLRGTFLCAREAAKYIRKNQHGGAIVNIASTRAFMSEEQSEAYAATKGGIVALTHALSISLQNDFITVNSISPGWIATGDYSKLREIDHNQHPSKRVGKPEDIARACIFLTNPRNDFITGENLIIDGGMTRKMIY